MKGVKVAIIGDISHSRVARSNIWLLKKLGADIHVAGPPSLLPKFLSTFGVTVHSSLDPALEEADFVMALRLQLERQQQGLIPSIQEYRAHFGLNHARLKLAKPTVRVMHPGPVNRGIEVTDDLIDDTSISLLTRQVANGIPIRMASLLLLFSTEDQIISLD
jgi:aspartate carbamoyltransferase catalytic subunit